MQASSAVSVGRATRRANADGDEIERAARLVLMPGEEIVIGLRLTEFVSWPFHFDTLDTRPDTRPDTH